MPFQIIRNDITRVSADVIVNTANPKPEYGSGTDGAVYAAAGADRLLEARKKIGEIEPGQAVSTPAFALSAKYIIHTVGPAWLDGLQGEKDILRACYENTLALAAELKAESIAFPLIATGVYGFPKDEALNIALSEIGKFLLTHDMQVILVVFGREAFALSEKLVGSIDAYLDEHQVSALEQTEYASTREKTAEHRRRRAAQQYADSSAVPQTPFHMQNKPLDQILSDTGDTFQQRLFKLIDASGMDDVTVYKKANIDRKVFSRIRCKKDYKPTKKTAVAFAVALKLSLPEMLGLLACAGITFSPSDKFDLIITYCVQNGIYDIFEINAVLFQYGQALLGV
ncbi:MAG: macro domain-containing protein [Oscillospiraceae bacterium]|nr:macro domain-containing protein [Oscillospiraceae bacterium]